MKQNWEYKKLGDVATFINGYPFKPSEWKSEGCPIIRIQNLNNPLVAYNYYDKPLDERYIVKSGDVLISWSGTLGVYEWSGEKAFLNQHIFKVLFNKGEINKSFFKYVVSSRIQEMKSKVHGITMQHITKGDFDKTKVPVPPLSEQSRIVAELDLLTGIIDKQNAQLKELDNLAQAIFYDMFGDPIENPKGWEVKKMGDVAQDIFAGGDKPEDCSDQLSDEYRYPVIANGVGDRGVLGYSKEYRVGVDAVTVGARGASIGNCRICKAFFTPVVRLITIIPGVNFDIVYLFYAVQLLNFNINGAGQAQLTVPNVKSQNVVVPPLALQQSFAEKIQSIEKQKEAIRASIADTQKLLDYTMDKYFG